MPDDLLCVRHNACYCSTRNVFPIQLSLQLSIQCSVAWLSHLACMSESNMVKCMLWSMHSTAIPEWLRQLFMVHSSVSLEVALWCVHKWNTNSTDLAARSHRRTHLDCTSKTRQQKHCHSGRVSIDQSNAEPSNANAAFGMRHTVGRKTIY